MLECGTVRTRFSNSTDEGGIIIAREVLVKKENNAKNYILGGYGRLSGGNRQRGVDLTV